MSLFDRLRKPDQRPVASAIPAIPLPEGQNRIAKQGQNSGIAKIAVANQYSINPHPEIECWGLYTPYCCPISPELVAELHHLIARYAELYRLADHETGAILNAAKRQSAASVPGSIAYFKKHINQKS